MDNNDFVLSSLSTIALARNSRRKRLSSYDRSGGNDDRIYIEAGETRTFAEIKGAGCINHIWCTIAGENFVEEKNYLRKIILRMYWDGEEFPSVEAPIGDFFGMGHAMCRNFVSAPLQMSPQDGRALNCWFPMPYAKGAKFELVNQCDKQTILYFYVDYEEIDTLPDNMLRFHAKWNRECPTKGVEQGNMTNREWLFGGTNTTGEDNYVLLDAEGKGHYVGCNINIHNLRDTSKWDWPGEGDDMIFIDGEKWPPTLHGTGTEDYVNMGWCPTQEYSAPYHGLILGGQDNWKGKITYYRYHIQDPITFEKSIKVTIEHGNANYRSDDWSSTAYWYQTEPHKKFPSILPVKQRLPIDDEEFIWEWK
jgi:hypothetical protein